MNNVEKYKGMFHISMKETLNIIDSNDKGFAIIVNDNDSVVGVVTDGDIRRAILRGYQLDDGIKKAMQKKFKFVRIDKEIKEAIEIFKDISIDFLPILDEEDKLVNVITKKQMHALLLQDIPADLEYDFSSIDENIIDYEIYPRPWGFYKTTMYNEYYQAKVISVKPGGKLSLQSHGHREEYWIVVHGNGLAQVGESEIKLSCGSYVFVPKACKHRLFNIDGKESLIITEVQIGDYLGEDDIQRYDDVYGRV